MGGLVKPEEVSRVPWILAQLHADFFCQFDYFHEVQENVSQVLALCLTPHYFQLIITQELGRCGQRGYGDGQDNTFSPKAPIAYPDLAGLMAGSVIGLPPVLNFGSEAIKAKVIPDVLSGKKLICLAISEAFAGSDVAGLKTTAVKTEDGKHWIINGTWVEHNFFVGILGLIILVVSSKKWITNGT
jgi:alkylation response protein AidB-like acyl-CoA dehydrogenase